MIKLFFIIFSVALISCNKQSGVDPYKLPSDYQKWKKPVNRVLTYPISGHGNKARIIYANNKAYQLKADFSKDVVKYIVPDGGIVVKEIYEKKGDIGKEEPVLTYMVKQSTSPDAKDGWVYLIKKPGTKEVVVRSTMCVRCHDAANKKHPYFDGNKSASFRDYLFVPLKDDIK